MVRLVFTRAPGLVSWVIRGFGTDEVSHVGIQIGLDAVISAEQHGVVQQDVKSFMDGRSAVEIYQATEEGEPHLDVHHAMLHIGDKYGFKELPGFAAAEIEARLGAKDPKNPLHDPHAYVCSEFALLLDDETGFVSEFRDLDPETTKPQRLLERLRAGGPTFRMVPNTVLGV